MHSNGSRQASAVFLLLLVAPAFSPFILAAPQEPAFAGPIISLMPAQDPSKGPGPVYPVASGPSSRLSGARAEGTANVIVIPIQFAGLNHSVKNSVENITNKSFSDVPGANSVNNYYKEASSGKFNIAGEVSPWVNSTHNMSYYGEDGSYIDNKNGPIYGLVIEAVLQADPFIDFAQFDDNNDGAVDRIFIVHAGQGQEAMGGSKNDIWSHHWAVLDGNLSMDGAQALIVDGVQIYSYSMVSEFSPIGTWAHELGHDLGLPDLYDIDGTSYGIGKWGLMGTGSWNGGGTYPAHPCAWSKIQLGWVSPVDIVGPVTNITVSQVGTGGDILRLWIGDPERSKEYFLIENRQKVGFDQKLPGDGILIWHIDDAQTSNTDDVHRLVDLEEADEATGGDSPTGSGDPWVSNENGFNQYSVPSSDSYDGLPSGWTIESISASGKDMYLGIDIISNDIGVAFLAFERYVPEGAPATIDAHVFNFGIKDQANVVVRIVVTQGSSVIDTVDETVPSLKAKKDEVVRFVFTPAVQGNYIISARTILVGDQVPENDEAVEILHATTIIFKDDVEKGENGWKHASNRPPSDLWRIIDDTAGASTVKSPRHSWFGGVGDRTGSNYVPLSDYYLERTIDVRLVKEGFLVFDQRLDLTFSVQNRTTPVSDKAYVEVRTNLESVYTVLDTYSGTSGGWQTKIYDVTPFIGKVGVFNITVRFRLETQLLGYNKGWWIDDILIVGQWTERDVAILLNKTMMSARPGGTYTVDVTVWNSGSLKDTYILKVYAPPFWEASLALDEIVIEPLSSKGLMLTFTASKKALSTDELNIQVEATSKSDAAVTADAKLLVIVERTYGLDVDDSPTTHVMPGEMDVHFINITNRGNGKEMVNLAIGGSDSEWGSLSSNNITLEAFETKAVELKITVPLKAPADKIAELELRASTNGGIKETGRIKLVVDRSYGLSLGPFVDGVLTTPEGYADLSFNLTNTGNDQDRVALVYSAPPGWKITGSTKETLGAWDSVIVMITVEVPSDTPLSRFTIKVRATSVDGKIVEEIGLSVQIVLPDPAIVDMELSKTLLNKPGNVTITVVLTNKGTGNITEVMVSFYDGRKLFQTLMVDNLAKGESRTLTVSRNFGAGRHDVAVILTYEGAQADKTNDEVHETLKVKEESLFIPGFGAGLGVFVLIAAIVLVSTFGRKRL